MADNFPKELPSVEKEPAPAEDAMGKPFTKRDQASVNDAKANAMPPVVRPPSGVEVEVKQGDVVLKIKHN